jgi:hypothetical protein
MLQARVTTEGEVKRMSRESEVEKAERVNSRG